MSENQEKKYHSLSEKIPSKIPFWTATTEYFQSILGVQAKISKNIEDAICRIHDDTEQKIQNIITPK